MWLSSSTSSSTSCSNNPHSALPVVVPFDGMSYPFSMTVIGDRGRQQHLYGMDTEQETFFTAMSFAANGIVLCSLDVVKVEEDEPFTIGYFYLKDHQELVVVIIDKDTGDSIHLLPFLQILFLCSYF